MNNKIKDMETNIISKGRRNCKKIIWATTRTPVEKLNLPQVILSRLLISHITNKTENS